MKTNISRSWGNYPPMPPIAQLRCSFYFSIRLLSSCPHALPRFSSPHTRVLPSSLVMSCMMPSRLGLAASTRPAPVASQHHHCHSSISHFVPARSFLICARFHNSRRHYSSVEEEEEPTVAWVCSYLFFPFGS